MLIKNYKDISFTKLRKNALDILVAGVEEVMLRNIIPKKVRFYKGTMEVCGHKFDISKGKIFVIGGGKASGAMAQALENIIPLKKMDSGLVNVKYDNIRTKKIILNKAGHPVPDEGSINGVKKMLDMTKHLKEDDTVICLISGGGSALMSYPVPNVSLVDLQKTTDLLVKSGADVYEINIVRKHLSRIKGGNLAKYLQPARVISLIIYDTPDKRDATASGPTLPDNSTFSMACGILKRYNLLGNVPETVVNHLEEGIKGNVPETVKANEPWLSNVHNFILVDNKNALESMKDKAVSLGFVVDIVPYNVNGKVKEVAKEMGKVFNKKYTQKNKKYALLYGGEITVSVKGNGKGGRIQEYLAYSITNIKEHRNSVIASIGSDGIDYIEGIGGAIIDNDTYKRIMDLKIDVELYLKNNDTFNLHRKLGTLIFMKPTNTNVSDLHLYLYDKQDR